MTSNDPEQIRADIEATRAALSQDVDNLEEKVSPSKIAQRQTDKVRSAVSGVKDKVFGAASDAGESASGAAHGSAEGVREATHAVADAAKSAPGDVRSKAQGNPLAAGIVAFGVGMLVAALLPASRTEKDALHTMKEDEGVQRAAEELKGAAQDIGATLQHPATEAFEHVRETAITGAQSVKDTASTGAQGVASEARHGSEQVKEQVRYSQGEVQDQVQASRDAVQDSTP